MKSGRGVVIGYSSTHEKEIPDGSIRRRMELHRASPSRPQGIRTAENPQPPRDPRRHLLPPKEWLPVAPAPPRLSQVAHRLPLLQEMAHGRYLGEDQPGPPRTPTSSLEERSSAQRWRGGQPIGEEHRRRRRTARFRRGQEGEGQKASLARRH